MANGGIYATSDIHLATALRVAGLKFVGISREGRKGTFKFEDSPQREQIVMDFYNGDLIQNVKQFIEHWFGFKKMVSELR